MGYPPKGPADHLELGDWNATCWVCGGKRKASEMRRHWQGHWVCPEHWEPRHPQDFVRAPGGERPPPWTQPDNDTPIYSCDAESQDGRVGYGVVGCFRVGADPIPNTAAYMVEQEAPSALLAGLTAMLGS